MDTLHFIILALATWRMSSLLAQEKGPGDIFSKIRARLGVMYINDEVVGPAIARGITCIWCNSMWTGAVAGISYYLMGTPIVWLALPFALSASAIIIGSIVNSE